MTVSKTEMSRLEGDTPAQRLLALLEVIAAKDEFFTLQSLVEEIGLPKPTLHRMLQQLETSGMLQRESDNRHYSKGSRLRRLAENLLFNDTIHGARHRVLSQLMDDVGESCNITALSGSEVLYLDRVETSAPLRFYLHPGSRVPVHCSASGKLFLAQMAPAQRRRLLGEVPLKAFTPNTLTAITQLENEIEQVLENGYAFDEEEYLEGLICIAVIAPNPRGKSNLGIAIQAPTMRMSREQAIECLPALQRAARSIAEIDQEAIPKASRAMRSEA